MLKSIKSFLPALQSNNKPLLDAVKTISRVKNYERILPAVLEAFIKFTATRKASLMVPDEDGFLSIRAASGVSPAAWKIVKLRADEGLAGESLKSSEIVYVKDVSKDYRYKRFYPDSSKKTPGESLAIIPLIHQGEKLGAVSLHGVQEPDTVSLGIIADFAAKTLKNILLEKAVVTEPMTGLYNQTYFKKRLASELKLSKKYKLSLFLLLFDIDFFKKFNDTYGHLAGDFVIKELARLLKNTLRFLDVKSRYGGEEFAVIMSDICRADAVGVAERLRKKIEDTEFVYEGQRLKVTISAGLADGSSATEPASLIKNADDALYKSKQLGRNRVTVAAV